MYGTGDVKLFSPEIKDDAVKVTVHDTAEGPGGALPVEMTREEARELGLALLVMAGPNSDEIVRTWIAGKVRLTIEAPAGNEEVLDPFISIEPRDVESFNRLVETFGGLQAFDDVRAEHRPSLTMHAPAVALDAERAKAMYVSVTMPKEMRETKPTMPEAVKRLADRQAELKEVQREEQAAAERIEAERAAAVEASHGPHPLAGTEGE